MKKLLLTAACALLAATGAYAQSKADHLAIIVGKDNGLDSTTSAELAKIFRAEKAKGPDGNKFVIVQQDVGSPARTAALNGIYKMTEAEYSKYFLQATFTGAVTAAPKAMSAAAVKQFVAQTPGAIGYIRADEVDDTVKAVKVDGKAPGEAGYPLAMK